MAKFSTIDEGLTPEQIAMRVVKCAEFKGYVASLRYRILGLAKMNPEWYKAHLALEFCLEHHTGWRKDKVTPAAMHQIQIANHIMNFMSDMLFPIRTVIAGLLHDTPEDTAVSHNEVRDNFGAETEEDVEILTKEYRGDKKDLRTYHAAQAKNPVTSIVKPVDRNNNMESMAGVFAMPKQIEYCDEVDLDYFDMLKISRRAFPQQEPIYESLKRSLKIQVKLYRSAHAKGFAL